MRFGEFVLDPDAWQLSRGSDAVAISPKAFQLLLSLVEARPRVLSKDELIEILWSDVVVEEANIRNLVAELRGALGDSARDPTFIRTAHRHGYSFIAPVVSLASIANVFLVSTADVFALRDGINIVGRDPACAVQLLTHGVSRRHAQITVEKGTALLADLASKNGTWCNDSRISTPLTLRDGDRIGIGIARLVFRRGSDVTPTSTIRS